MFGQVESALRAGVAEHQAVMASASKDATAAVEEVRTDSVSNRPYALKVVGRIRAYQAADAQIIVHASLLRRACVRVTSVFLASFSLLLL